MNRPRTPGGPLPPHLATPSQMQLMQDRLQQKYGAFGHRPQDDDVDKRVLADDFFKPTLQVIGVVLLVTLLGFFAQAPTFDGPGSWANSPRLDTGLILFWGPALYFVMWRLPIWKSVRIYLVMSLFIEAFSEAMFRQMGEGGYWDTIMWPAAVAWFGTLKEFAGVPGASLSIFFFTTVALFVRVSRKKPADWVAPPRFAKTALQVFFVTVIGLAAWGIARGGQIEWTFRQTIHLLQLPIVAAVFLYTLRVPDDLAAVGTAFVTAAFARSLIVAYVYFGVCVPDGITSIPGKPEWCTNHSDTVLFVTALMILLAHALEQRKARVTFRAIGVAAVILMGIVLNNRRLAFISLGMGTLVTYLALKPSKRKRAITTALAIAVPALALYVLIGSEIVSSSPFLKPAKIIVSILEQKDTSSLSRDIENENLIYTLHQNLYGVVTTGFGHEYQYSPNNPPVDLGDVFKNFRLIAHNGVLWMWSLAGVFGFTLLWFVYPMTGTLAVRGYLAADSKIERSAALASLASIAVCVMQIYGDQGFNSYMTLITFGVSFAVAVRLASRPQAPAYPSY